VRNSFELRLTPSENGSLCVRPGFGGRGPKRDTDHSFRWFREGCIDSQVRKSFGYVGNLVYQLQRLLEADQSRVHKKTFFLADYEPVIVSDWANQIARHFGSPAVKSVPVAPLRVAAAVGDVLDRFGRRFPLTSLRLNNLTTDMVYDMSDMEAVVGPLPITCGKVSLTCGMDAEPFRSNAYPLPCTPNLSSATSLDQPFLLIASLRGWRIWLY
jgi:hypothetical protein